jgi:hypothetical protein
MGLWIRRQALNIVCQSALPRLPVNALLFSAAAVPADLKTHQTNSPTMPHLPVLMAQC